MQFLEFRTKNLNLIKKKKHEHTHTHIRADWGVAWVDGKWSKRWAERKASEATIEIKKITNYGILIAAFLVRINFLHYFNSSGFVYYVAENLIYLYVVSVVCVSFTTIHFYTLSCIKSFDKIGTRRVPNDRKRKNRIEKECGVDDERRR